MPVCPFSLCVSVQLLRTNVFYCQVMDGMGDHGQIKQTSKHTHHRLCLKCGNWNKIIIEYKNKGAIVTGVEGNRARLLGE